MARESEHAACIEAWVTRLSSDDAEGLARAFERAFAAIYQTALPTLGGVTLPAIVDRVLYDASERFPILAPLAVGADGLRCEALCEQAAALGREPLLEALRFVMVEFLTVLGNLTAEILSDELHQALLASAGHPTA